MTVDISTITSIDDEEKTYSFELTQNYPNPFNPSTLIKFTVGTPPHPSPYQGEGAREGSVLLRVYNVLGKEVTTLVNKSLQPGEYEVEFDGSHLTSGIYFYRLQTNEKTDIKKMILVK
ncbi:MAG: T9SS type A sorting domain-containing protein [Melioribacteraceae bacterium]|nr:T9SS type A sorting domain-containing protein [Melioribacteraceae bacterium]